MATMIATAVNTGAKTFHLHDGRSVRWLPKGPIYVGHAAGATRVASERGFRPSGKTIVGRTSASAKAPSKVERLGGGGLSARILVGLNVEDKTVWSIEEVVEAFGAIRASQQAPADASFIAQQGTYTQEGLGLVEEPSVQIIVIDTRGADPDVWERQMRELAFELRRRFEQKSVIVEIQDHGVTKDVFEAQA